MLTIIDHNTVAMGSCVRMKEKKKKRTFELFNRVENLVVIYFSYPVSVCDYDCDELFFGSPCHKGVLMRTVHKQNV